jgi:hypothetical protein
LEPVPGPSSIICIVTDLMLLVTNVVLQVTVVVLQDRDVRQAT